MAARATQARASATRTAAPPSFRVQLIQPVKLQRAESCDKLLVYLPGTDGTGQAILPQIEGLRAAGYDVWCLYIPPDDRSDWGQLTTQVTLLLRQLLGQWISSHPGAAAADAEGAPAANGNGTVHRPPQPRITIVGESFGCCLALRIAASGAGPELLDRLVLVNPATSFNRSLSGVSSLIAATNLLSLFPRDWYSLAQTTLLPLLVDSERVEPPVQQLLESMIRMEPPPSRQGFGFGRSAEDDGPSADASSSNSLDPEEEDAEQMVNGASEQWGTAAAAPHPNRRPGGFGLGARIASSKAASTSGNGSGPNGGRPGGDGSGALYYGPAAAANFRTNLLRSGELPEEELARVATPVLLVTSARDRLLPSIVEGARLERALPNARRLILPDSGHAAMLERGIRLPDLMRAAGFDAETLPPPPAHVRPPARAGAAGAAASSAAAAQASTAAPPAPAPAPAAAAGGTSWARGWNGSGGSEGQGPVLTNAVSTSSLPSLSDAEGESAEAAGSIAWSRPGAAAERAWLPPAVAAAAAATDLVYRAEADAAAAAAALGRGGAGVQGAMGGSAEASSSSSSSAARAARKERKGGAGAADAEAEGGDAAAPDDSAFDEWCQKLAPWRDLISPVVLGFEHLPPPGSPGYARPMLFVGNHQKMGFYDTPLLVYELYVRGYRARGLAHPGHWAGPFGAWFEQFGAVKASPMAAYRLLRGGEKVLLFPGGAKEVVKKRGQEYTLLWKDTPDFVRLAARCNALIVPFAAVGADDAYDVIMDTDEVIAHPVLGPMVRGLLGRVSSALDPQESIFPITRLPGLGIPTPVPVPNLQRLYFKFAPPVDPSALGMNIKDPQQVQALYDGVRHTVNQCMSELLVVRDADADSQVGARLGRSLQRLVPLLGGAAAAVTGKAAEAWPEGDARPE